MSLRQTISHFLSIRFHENKRWNLLSVLAHRHEMAHTLNHRKSFSSTYCLAPPN